MTATVAVPIIVPADLGDARVIAVEWGDALYTVTVPEGMGAGQELHVELPVLAVHTVTVAVPEFGADEELLVE